LKSWDLDPDPTGARQRVGQTRHRQARHAGKADHRLPAEERYESGEESQALGEVRCYREQNRRSVGKPKSAPQLANQVGIHGRRLDELL
jgi:hypothetical protein